MRAAVRPCSIRCKLRSTVDTMGSFCSATRTVCFVFIDFRFLLAGLRLAPGSRLLSPPPHLPSPLTSGRSGENAGYPEIRGISIFTGTCVRTYLIRTHHLNHQGIEITTQGRCNAVHGGDADRALSGKRPYKALALQHRPGPEG